MHHDLNYKSYAFQLLFIELGYRCIYPVLNILHGNETSTNLIELPGFFFLMGNRKHIIKDGGGIYKIWGQVLHQNITRKTQKQK